MHIDMLIFATDFQVLSQATVASSTSSAARSVLVTQLTMTSKPKYTQEISKLAPGSSRIKEQVAGRLVHYWKEDVTGGKSKTCAVFLDGLTSQNVLIAEAWGGC